METDGKLKQLPQFYNDIKPLYLPDNVPIVSGANLTTNSEESDNLSAQFEKEKMWLDHVAQSKDKSAISWAAYHSSQIEQQQIKHADITALLPVWKEDSKSPAMIKHTMDVVQNAVSHLNPGQAAVIALDQPLYAISKRIQWKYPDIYGKFVVMMGSLHTEMALMGALGNWLEDSGWTNIIHNSGVSRSGVAENLLTGHEVARNKYAHQVTAAALHILRQKAYEDRSEHRQLVTFEHWCYVMEENNPNFKYWTLTLKFDMILLLFLRSIHSGDFKLYKVSMKLALPWLFAMDRTHYARWLSIHSYDMDVLKQTNVDVYNEFNDHGNFVTSRTENNFSSMGLDHRHEQHNKDFKGDGGAVGLTESDEKLTRWMVCGPEVARCIREFEIGMDLDTNKSTDFRHHEHTPSFQSRFDKHVNATVAEFEKYGNPFAEDSPSELIQIVSRNVMTKEMTESIYAIEKCGEDQYTDFLQQRIVKKTKSVDDPIPKNKFPSFSASGNGSTRPVDNEKKALRSDLKLFSQLFIATQIRDGDLATFISHENIAHPPPLSQHGEILAGTKSELLACLKTCYQPDLHVATIDVALQSSGKILEGSVLVNMLKPEKRSTFKEYAEQTIVPKISKALASSTRVDIIFDKYLENSLKETARKKRGKGIRRKVEDESETPSNWSAFRINGNKQELFPFLSKHIVQQLLNTKKQVATAFETEVLTLIISTTNLLAPCNHEEADTRIFLHAKHMNDHGHSSVTIRTVDTDVVVIAIAKYFSLNLKELWIDFGTGKDQMIYPVHILAKSLGREKSEALLFFHAFTGCDQTSFMYHCKKKTAWATWVNYAEATKTFQTLSNKPSKEDVFNCMSVIERFVVLMYEKTSNLISVNECRQHLFVKKGKTMEALPPTRDALLQHVFRSAYQAGYVWSQSMLPMQQLPVPEQWGWKKDDEKFIPFWTEKPVAAIAVRELIKCGCNVLKGCRGNCKCLKAALPCTALCKCNGDCERE